MCCLEAKWAFSDIDDFIIIAKQSRWLFWLHLNTTVEIDDLEKDDDDEPVDFIQYQ
jgi:hypothetical protein